MADFTYIWTAEGWLYVAAFLDLYSRGITAVNGDELDAIMAARR